MNWLLILQCLAVYIVADVIVSLLVFKFVFKQSTLRRFQKTILVCECDCEGAEAEENNETN